MSNNNPTEVKKHINSGRTPLLAFEREILESQLRKVGVEQSELGKLLGEAMRQSSETWHDNAPADAIVGHSKIVASKASKILRGLGTAVILGYPNKNDKRATIGTVLGLRYPAEKEDEYMLLTGFVRDSKPQFRSNVSFPSSKLEIVTVSSPLGSALLGHTVGENVQFRPNGQRISVAINSLVQLQANNLR